jgi:hypothetical protein
MLLYFPAGAIPLLLATIWCVVPGNFNAPQRWYMSIPDWCDLVNGTTFYLAGILIAAREARWFGSRILPLGIGVILALAAMLLPLNVFEALLITAIGWVILIPATHGAFVHRESTNRQSSMSLAAQALTVICGVGILTGISWAFIESVARSAGRTRQAYTSPPAMPPETMSRLIASGRNCSCATCPRPGMSLRQFPRFNAERAMAFITASPISNYCPAINDRGICRWNAKLKFMACPVKTTAGSEASAKTASSPRPTRPSLLPSR